MKRLDAILGLVPRFLASHYHVLWLISLGIYLIVLPMCGVHVSNFAELVGGNYTNVTSDIGACIAAGGTLHLIGHVRKQNQVIDELRHLIGEIHHHHGLQQPPPGD